MADVRQGALEGGLPYFSVGTGPPLVVLSGLSATHANPKGIGLRLEAQLLRAFAQHFTVYEVNRKPGLLPGATMHDIAADYATALDKEFDDGDDVIGISTGGSVAQQLALDHPARVGRLIIASSACRLSDHGRAVQRRVAERARAGDIRGAYREIGTALVRHPIAQRLVGGLVWAAGPLLMGSPDDPSDMLITIEAEDSFDVTDELPRIAAPTLVVGGERDPFYSPELFRTTAERVPDAKLCLYPGKGHVGALGKQYTRDALAFLGA
jgi:pimeloyl-ACP methyl ester carboxylesterase